MREGETHSPPVSCPAQWGLSGHSMHSSGPVESGLGGGQVWGPLGGLIHHPHPSLVFTFQDEPFQLPHPSLQSFSMMYCLENLQEKKLPFAPCFLPLHYSIKCLA